MPFVKTLPKESEQQMGWGKSTTKNEQLVEPGQVKACALCDALNYAANTECHLCGWRGAWNRDKAVLALAWQRLEDQFEEVRMEHITKARRGAVEELGHVAHRTPWQEARHRTQAWWRGVGYRRRLRAEARVSAPSAPGINHSAQ